jgi:hypothetical protein
LTISWVDPRAPSNDFTVVSADLTISPTTRLAFSAVKRELSIEDWNLSTCNLRDPADERVLSPAATIESLDLSIKECNLSTLAASDSAEMRVLFPASRIASLERSIES